MKIIMLDIDGVCNQMGPSYSTPIKMVGDILTQVEPEIIYRFNLLVDRTDAEIVLSSSWRYHPNWREIMKASGIVKSFLDRTPFDRSYSSRGHSIQAWLDDHTEVEKYAIIDDDRDMLPAQLPNFFHCNEEEGLTEEIAKTIELHLS